MTKRSIFFFLTLLAFVSANAQSAYYNVKDFGAKGDGTNIDSHAINAALERAKEVVG